ncbi:type-F conjugative transfer system mating-pair stabilization protein TraN [Pantoea stewartii]|uniref:type-F conjugative transfer system mating-pair stabilization protein TraN n=1 Tax=Pantoea stewartii TaxID=66269 RepID=UPI0025A2FB08|nr:type-F conjugative transfer system mating-pair stabilization protein TraN [Pantoea stewartii]
MHRRFKCDAYEKSVFTNYVCDRDLQVQQYCTRTATITGDWTTDSENKYYEISPAYSRNGKQIVFSFTMPASGVIQSANLKVDSSQYLMKSQVNFMNTTFFINQNEDTPLNAAGMNITKDQIISGTSCSGSGKCTGSVDDILYQAFLSGKAKLTLKMTLRVETRKWNPRVEWSENCPFDKAEGSLTGTECTEPGGDKTVTVEGKPYTVHQDCWAYRDSYLTQSESEGTCGAYIHNAACNVVNQQCVDQGDGACLHANITYSCETKMKGEGQVCGDELFCTDGSCVLDNNGKNDMFAKAASELAAVAAAGKDVAELNSNDVKIFTGKGVSCKKFAAGFSNCCKDSGWGQDVGLASCSSDEKALGKAKEKRLTVYVGEYCSKKVLGVCLEKKRGYCEFDSKLAQIVQQQGRSWQLGIGFGSGSSPDCRGITPEELQKIDFSKVDFSAFYDDLNSGSDIPADNNQMEKMKERMKAMFDQGSSH